MELYENFPVRHFNIRKLLNTEISQTTVCAYLYSVVALVGGAISIRDPYICAVHESVPTNHTLSSTGPLFVQ